MQIVFTLPGKVLFGSKEYQMCIGIIHCIAIGLFYGCMYIPGQLFAQNSTGNFPPRANAPVINATQISEERTIDGKLAEYALQQASVVDQFFRQETQ